MRKNCRSRIRSGRPRLGIMEWKYCITVQTAELGIAAPEIIKRQKF